MWPLFSASQGPHGEREIEHEATHTRPKAERDSAGEREGERESGKVSRHVRGPDIFGEHDAVGHRIPPGS